MNVTDSPTTDGSGDEVTVVVVDAAFTVCVTDSPTTDGSGDEVTAVVVDATFTVWVSVPVEEEKSPSPP
ncbi:hypothetical protein [Streptomyces sp. NRRL S-455]|uniref:hypothetical protein n=1 Tax=Streptomyces sp. NRRL S-455 TaxID=1463908 RepID=UPI001F2558C4|nr:hypothetical protein [Streptomyces sp. NRRL S-455]